MTFIPSNQVASEIRFRKQALGSAIELEKDVKLQRADADRLFDREIESLLIERDKLIQEVEAARLIQAKQESVSPEHLAKRAHALAAEFDISCSIGVGWESLVPEHKAAWSDFVRMFLLLYRTGAIAEESKTDAGLGGAS